MSYFDRASFAYDDGCLLIVHPGHPPIKVHLPYDGEEPFVEFTEPQYETEH
jgi:hypothetical protein